MMLAALFWEFWFRITGRAVYVSFNSRGAGKATSEVTDSKHVKRTCKGSSRPLGADSEAGASSRRPATALARSPYSDFHPTSPSDLPAPVPAHAPARARRFPGARGRSPSGAPAKDQNVGITFPQGRRPVFCRGPDWGALKRDFQNP